jgi:putative DNA primase/helicase
MHPRPEDDAAVHIEEALIGALMVSAHYDDGAAWKKVAGHVVAGDFRDAALADLFELQNEAKGKLDRELLAAKRPDLRDYLADLFERGAANMAEEYAKAVATAARNRRSLDLLRDTSRQVAVGVPPSQALKDLAEAAAEQDGGAAPKRFRVDYLLDFVSLDLPKRSHLLAPIIPEKGLAMVYAPRGLGKTYFSTGIAEAIASGGHFLKWHAERPRKVFLVDGEMPQELLQERAERLLASSRGRMPTPDYFGFVAMDRQDLGVAINLARPEDQAGVEAAMGDAEFLVIDNISTLVNGGRENDAESWDSMQGWLLHLRRKGVSVLLVAHAGRGENARGTSKREDVLDTVIQLKRPDDYDPEEGARFQVHITKGRGVFGDDAAAFEAQLQTDGGSDVWTYRDLKNVLLDQIIEMTKADMTVREIAEQLGIDKSKVNRLQKKLREGGLLP